MPLKDYDINQVAAIGGGLLGAGLGLGAYALGSKRSAARLLAHMAIGGALGAGAGTLATITKKKSDAETVKETKNAALAKLKDSQLARMDENSWAGRIDAGGAAGGYLLGRGVREKLSAKPTKKFTAAGNTAQVIDAIPGKAAVLEAPAEIKLNGKVLTVDPAKVDLTGLKDLKNVTDSDFLDILRSNGIDLDAEGITRVKKGKTVIDWDRLHKLRNDKISFKPAKDAAAAVAAVPARVIIGGVDYTDDAVRYFGSAEAFKKAKGKDIANFLKHLKRLDYLGPSAVGNAPLAQKIGRIFGLGGRKMWPGRGGRVGGALRLLTALTSDLGSAAAGYYATKHGQDAARDIF